MAFVYDKNDLSSTKSTSALCVTAGTQISVNRDLSAGLNSRLPKSPPGFIVANIRNCSSALTSLLKLWTALLSCAHTGPSPPFSARVIVLDGSKTEFRRSKTASSARLISSKSNIQPSFIDVTRGPSTHSNSEVYFWYIAVTSSRVFLTNSPCTRFVGDAASAVPLASLRLFLSDVSVWAWSSFVFPRYDVDSSFKKSTIAFGSCDEGEIEDMSNEESFQFWTSSDTIWIISSTMFWRPRMGRKPPKRSLVSVLAWQLTTVRCDFRMTDRSWTTVVFPQPVSPTNRTGSFCLIQRMTRESSLKIDLVGAIESTCKPDSDRRCFCDKACSSMTRPSEPSP